jgi:hypothetical protein
MAFAIPNRERQFATFVTTNTVFAKDWPKVAVLKRRLA